MEDPLLVQRLVIPAKGQRIISTLPLQSLDQFLSVIPILQPARVLLRAQPARTTRNALTSACSILFRSQAKEADYAYLTKRVEGSKLFESEFVVGQGVRASWAGCIEVPQLGSSLISCCLAIQPWM
jgi:hypothetical protein